MPPRFATKILLLLLFAASCAPSKAFNTAIPPLTIPASQTPITPSTIIPHILAATSTRIAEEKPLYPLAVIQILSPVDAFPLTSPFELIAKLPANYQGIVSIELLGTEGRMLAKSLFQWDSKQGTETQLRKPLIFEITSEEEKGRLSISVSDEFGRLMALSSVDVLLHANGQRESFVAIDFIEKIWIQTPAANSLHESTVIQITGIAFLKNTGPLSVQIITREGRVLAFGEVYATFSPEDDFASFDITLELGQADPQWLQIAVLESGADIPGTVHFSSLEIMYSRE